MVNCDILIRTKRRTLTIQVDKAGQVVVKAPTFLSEKKINEFLLKKSKWIEKNKQKIIKTNASFSNIINMKSILFFGEEYEISFTNLTKSVQIMGNKLVVPSKIAVQDLPKHILKWYQKTAKILLKNRLDYFIDLTKLDYSKFSLTKSKTKWGSCSTSKHITLNSRIIALCEDEQDYIIVHEVCHLMEMNHSKAFYDCIEAILPNWKKSRDLIKNCNFILGLYRNA